MDHSQNALGIVAGLLEARTGQKLTADRLWRWAPRCPACCAKRGSIRSKISPRASASRTRWRSLSRWSKRCSTTRPTSFRDRAMFDHLSRNVLPALAERRQASRRLSVWSVGCSTGQEAYSLAMLFAEQPLRWREWTIDILGTDVARSVVLPRARGISRSSRSSAASAWRRW
jgi:chemotaxis protein methyltransferase CheR